MHNWGDKWFEKNGEEFGHMIGWFQNTAHRYGRIGGDIKEKFGTLRFYAVFHNQLHDLFYVGHYYIRWGKLLNWLDFTFYKHRWNPLRFAIRRYQFWLYGQLYARAVRKWPQFREEILDCVDYPEYLPKHLGVSGPNITRGGLSFPYGVKIRWDKVKS